MADDLGAIRSWAATHANTVAAGPRDASSAAAPVPGPLELISVTEITTWTADATYISATGQLQPGGQPVLAVGSRSGAVQIRDLDSGQTLRTLTGHTGGVQSMAWGNGPDGRLLLATASMDGTARTWDPETGETVRTLTGHTTRVDAVAWGTGPDQRRLLATGSMDDTARIWDPDTGQTLHTLTDHTGRVNSVAWGNGPDGQLLLATGSDDDTVRIWDPDTGQTLHTLTGHTDDVFSVAWGTGQPLATASPDGSARIWRQERGGFDAEVLDPRSDEAYCVAWAPLSDGRMLLAVTTSSGLTLWDGYSGRLLHTETSGFRDAGVNHLGWALGPGRAATACHGLRIR